MEPLGECSPPGSEIVPPAAQDLQSTHTQIRISNNPVKTTNTTTQILGVPSSTKSTAVPAERGIEPDGLAPPPNDNAEINNNDTQITTTTTAAAAQQVATQSTASPTTFIVNKTKKRRNNNNTKHNGYNIPSEKRKDACQSPNKKRNIARINYDNNNGKMKKVKKSKTARNRAKARLLASPQTAHAAPPSPVRKAAVINNDNSNDKSGGGINSNGKVDGSKEIHTNDLSTEKMLLENCEKLLQNYRRQEKLNNMYTGALKRNDKDLVNRILEEMMRLQLEARIYTRMMNGSGAAPIQPSTAVPPTCSNSSCSDEGCFQEHTMEELSDPSFLFQLGMKQKEVASNNMNQVLSMRGGGVVDFGNEKAVPNLIKGSLSLASVKDINDPAEYMKILTRIDSIFSGAEIKITHEDRYSKELFDRVAPRENPDDPNALTKRFNVTLLFFHMKDVREAMPRRLRRVRTTSYAVLNVQIDKQLMLYISKRLSNTFCTSSIVTW